MSVYKVASFYEGTFAKPSGPTIWNFLNEERIIGKMEAASFYNRPGVEPIGADLKELFPEEHRAEILNDTCKQMIGHMVRQ